MKHKRFYHERDLRLKQRRSGWRGPQLVTRKRSGRTRGRRNGKKWWTCVVRQRKKAYRALEVGHAPRWRYLHIFHFSFSEKRRSVRGAPAKNKPTPAATTIGGESSASQCIPGSDSPGLRGRKLECFPCVPESVRAGVHCKNAMIRAYGKSSRHWKFRNSKAYCFGCILQIQVKQELGRHSSNWGSQLGLSSETSQKCICQGPRTHHQKAALSMQNSSLLRTFSIVTTGKGRISSFWRQWNGEKTRHG